MQNWTGLIQFKLAGHPGQDLLWMSPIFFLCSFTNILALLSASFPGLPWLCQVHVLMGVWPRDLLNVAWCLSQGSQPWQSYTREVYPYPRGARPPGEAVLVTGCLNAVFPRERNGAATIHQPHGLSPPMRGCTAQFSSQAAQQKLNSTLFKMTFWATWTAWKAAHTAIL